MSLSEVTEIYMLDVILRFSYYTAGTGGAGPTILSTSFLLLGEEVVAYNKGLLSLILFLLFYCITSYYSRIDHFILQRLLLETGEKVKVKPYSGMLNVDFGKGVRKKDVFLL